MVVAFSVAVMISRGALRALRMFMRFRFGRRWTGRRESTSGTRVREGGKPPACPGRAPPHDHSIAGVAGFRQPLDMIMAGFRPWYCAVPRDAGGLAALQ